MRCIITICRFDYPEKWPTLLNDISSALQSGNDKGILTGCVALFCLAKKFEYEIDEGRQPIFEIMQQCNAQLGQICERYLAQLESETALTILCQVIKVFYTANQLMLCPYLKENNALAPWIQMFKIILEMPMPAQLESLTDEPEEIE